MGLRGILFMLRFYNDVKSQVFLFKSLSTKTHKMLPCVQYPASIYVRISICYHIKANIIYERGSMLKAYEIAYSISDKRLNIDSFSQ